MHVCVCVCFRFLFKSDLHSVCQFNHMINNNYILSMRLMMIRLLFKMVIISSTINAIKLLYHLSRSLSVHISFFIHIQKLRTVLFVTPNVLLSPHFSITSSASTFIECVFYFIFQFYIDRIEFVLFLL